MVARKILKEMFGIPVYIGIWHVMQIFRRTITKDEMNVTKEEREQCLQYIQRIIYSQSESQYNIRYNEFCQIAPKKVLDYFNINWHSIMPSLWKNFHYMTKRCTSRDGL